MAFQSKDLSVLAYANGFTLWHYTTIDLVTDVDTADYFIEAIDMLRVGDIIIANADTDGTPKSGFYLVSFNDGTTVDVNDMTQVGTADFD